MAVSGGGIFDGAARTEKSVAGDGCCVACSKPFDGEKVDVHGRYFHPECFKCSVCGKRIEQKFGDVGGAIHCDACLAHTTGFASSGGYEECAGCREQIFSGQVCMGIGKTWHPSCFKCERCQKVLGNAGFGEVEGKAYCPPCMEVVSEEERRREAPACAACNQKIVSGKIANALGKSWHPACFACQACRTPLTSSFVDRNGSPMCLPCANKPDGAPGAAAAGAPASAAPASAAGVGMVCGGCGKAVGAGKVACALDKNWHPECFVCTDCRSSLTSYVPVDGMPVCPACAGKRKEAAAAHSGNVCAQCNQPIVGERLQASGAMFHPNCFTCQNCQKLIEGDFMITSEKKRVCAGCATQSNTKSLLCRKCGKSITGPVVSIDRQPYHSDCAPVLVCPACSKNIGQGSVTEALGKHYHAGCFKCTACQQPFTDTFLDISGHPHCEACARKKGHRV